MPSLFAAILPAAVLFLAPPLLPVTNSPATVGLRVTSTAVTAQNFSNNPRWVVFSSGPVHISSLVAAHSAVVWSCTEDCLWDVQAQVVDTDGGVPHISQSINLYNALEWGGQALWFGQLPTCWLESNGELQPYFDSMAAPVVAPCHVPVVRPSDIPDGDKPPPIDNRPLPPI
jgi:hypothetical protein